MQGFNEAPIRESGKSLRAAFLDAGRDRFNEAPIRESGKSSLSCRTMPQSGASMRPRFANRGSKLNERHPLPDYEALQ